jgi:hypothetical protein
MGKRNQSRGFFRVWIALSLIWIMFVCGAAIVDLVRTLRLPPPSLSRQRHSNDRGVELPANVKGDGSAAEVRCLPGLPGGRFRNHQFGSLVQES